MKKYIIITVGYLDDSNLKKIENHLNDGWEIERADCMGNVGAAYILSKEVA